jgi:hypothetical protein
MKKTLAVLFAVSVGVFVACSSPTAPPEPQREVSSATAPAVTAVSTPAPVNPAVSAGAEWEGSIGAFGSWSVKNLTQSKQSYTAYYTDFDNQSKSLGSKTGTFQPQDVFSGSFEKTCIQVDVTQGPAGTSPFLFGYINKAGQVVKSITAADRLACAPACVPKYTYNSKLVLTADANLPSSGDSLFKYHVFKKVKGILNDKQVWEDNLRKGEVVYIQVPTDGAQYYAFYDGEVWNATETVTATCTVKDISALWHPKLRFECETINSCTAAK